MPGPGGFGPGGFGPPPPPPRGGGWGPPPRRGGCCGPGCMLMLTSVGAAIAGVVALVMFIF